MSDIKTRMSELIDILNKASQSYYAKDEEIMSNFEYDALYDELESLEKTSGIVLSNSPTQRVGYESVDFLPKEAHDAPMLSLSKTKSVDELKEWIGEKDGVISWKYDGLTIVLTYENGSLLKAVTRGNGEIGEVVTANARTFENIPLSISVKEKLILRGEAVITYPDFEKVNAKIESEEDKYKNPRNLCSGSVRQLNSKITSERHVRFMAFSLVSFDGQTFEKRSDEYEFLRSLGFDVVEYLHVSKDTLEDSVKFFAEKIKTYEIPSDGLVLCYDDIAYGKSLGRTAKFPRDAIAFKWQDETAKTVLREIEWSPSRTGLINPVAIFDTVELEGTSVSRASVHNLSVLEELKLGIEDEILVYKANMIIPQIAENLTKSGRLTIPNVCPCCKMPTSVHIVKEAKTLFCDNEECPAKAIKKFSLFVSRDAMNVDGLSEATLEKFIDRGFIRSYSDMFSLKNFNDELVTMEGFGEKSINNLYESLEKAKDVSLANFIYSLGILNVGLANAKVICKAFSYDISRILSATKEDMTGIDGIGDVIAESFCEYFKKPENLAEVKKLLDIVRIKKEETVDSENELAGKTVVVTGSLNLYASRKDLQAEIEKCGGKLSGSVSKNTFVLVNNDAMSSSSKNKAAKELNIPIMTEEEFVNTYLR